MGAKHKSTRLEGFDYSSEGAYFITICAQDRLLVFESEEVGKMIEKWWGRLEEKFEGAIADESVVMPNHVHGIVFIGQGPTHRSAPTQEFEFDVGADPRVRPDGARSTHRATPTGEVSLGRIVQWFKTMTTNEYIRCVKSEGWVPFPDRLWQRNYYDHIIRDEEDLNRARRYIQNNPARWHLDRYNQETKD